MAEKKPGKASGKAMAALLRQGGGVGSPEPVPMLQEPGRPSAEYVARAAQLMGRPGMGPETVSGTLEDERELGGMYGRQPLAPQAAARLPVQNPNMAAQQRMARQAFAGAQAGGTPVDPRMLALALRSAR